MDTRNIMDKLTDRFISYTKIHTTSDPASTTFPSTGRQKHFAEILAGELIEIGLSDVEIDENGYVMATLPANTGGEMPVVGFVAHMDTSPDFSGENVQPQIIRNYNGIPLILNKEKGITLDPAEFPELEKCIGLDLITTDGTTLLGADDKAGIAEIITAMEILVHSTEIKHGKIRICFTPDEEIGHGADHFDVQKFGADFAYTLDGSELGELEYENFNAALANLKIQGKSVHPGTAKNKMVNSMIVGHRIIGMLPPSQRPEHTEGMEGFFHLVGFTGSVDHTELGFIIRDHDVKKFLQKKEMLSGIVDLLNKEYGNSPIKLEMADQYYNMRQKIEPVMYVIDLAKQAMAEAGIEPKIKAIRGGTDGARLSYMGLPCPNLFAGGMNFHGPFEFVPVQYMEKAVEVILNICKLTAQMKR
jgi:tripeptide aminopeptidase